MDTNYKITIPEPCHEDWNQMTPDQTGRFCDSCAKSVVDFTNMKATEIQEYFINNQGKNVCGRFKNEQLDSIIIQIPSDILFSQVQFHKIFLLASLVCMGTTLFSCQNNAGDKQKIDKVEVVASEKKLKNPLKLNSPMMPAQTVKLNSAQYTNVLTGFTTLEPLPMVDSADYDCPAPNTKTVNKTAYDTLGNARITSRSFPGSTHPAKKEDYQDIVGKVAPLSGMDIPNTPEPDSNRIYSTALIDIKPEFPGGMQKFYNYIYSNLKIPKEDKATGNVYLSFIVNLDGSVSDIKILRGLNETIGKEVLRVMQSCPNWTPGQTNGQKIRVNYPLALKITAEE